MTDTTVEVQKEIFDQPLEGTELEAVNALVNQHKGNAALTQQLALDASRLITTSQERLAKQSGSGFFKRFASKISGKNSENQLKNQVDMLQMQRYAWHYLKQLQQQNLINAQSIAVIRNNLGTMNDYIIETRDFLEQAVDKINRRLEHVENNTSFNNWSLHIEANKRRFKSIPGTLLVLHLTYDFMRSHRDVVLTSRDINYLVVTLEKLEVNCDEDVQLLGFIIELIEQIEITGIERYREMIELAFDGHIIDSHFIQKNISGTGFNALYFLSEQYEKIIDLTEDSELCQSDEAREKIISKFFGNEFSGLSTTYRIRDLIGEVIGGSLLAIDIYKDVNGLNVIQDELAEDEHPEPLSLTSSLPDIRAHTFLDNTESDETRRNYLRLFALCIENSASLGKQGLEFLTLLAEKAGCPELCGEIAGLADNTYKTHEYLPIMQALLSDDDKIYTWLIDAFFLLTLCQKKIENPQVARILATLKPPKLKENFPHLLAIIKDSDETQVLNAAAKLAQFTKGWKNIVRYRELRFDQTYAETEKKLYTASIAASSLNFDLLKVINKASDYSYFMGSFDDDSFLGKLGSAVGGSAYALGRSSALSSLNDMRKKACEFISENSAALHQANRMVTQLNMPKIDFNNEISYSNYDLDNSATNEDWYDQFCRFERQIDNALTAFSDACSDADVQLGYFKAGEFDRSVVEIKVQKRAAQQLANQQEKLEKQSVVIEKDGREHRFSIEWQDVETPPCDPEQIRHIKTDGKVWLIVDDDGVFYRSEDREHWKTVQPRVSEDSLRVSKLDIVNGIWVLVAGYDEGFYYSSDALIWQQSCFPELPSSYDFSKTDDIMHFNGQWLWRFTERAEYSYTDKGFIFDSTKTSTYYKPLVYCTDRLDAQWQRWEGTPRFSEGVVVESMHSLPGVPCLLVFCKYDYLYTMVKKKSDAVSFVSYYIPGKDWRTCTWGGENDYYSDAIVTRMGGSLMCFYSNQFLTSDKGYDWKRQSENFYIGGCFHLESVSLFPSSNNGQVIYLSEDGKTFKEFMLDEGRWRYLCANDQGLLSVYELNSHETFLRAGRVICQPVG
ncbi:hypothetical protein [Pseudomonas sp. MWU12-2037]|uniref:hypothetical protein n=1 Tax=Pseudomonas sp. MWU12-2037 TaxID=2928690 RepID=UPI00200CBE73|nr:hypothetical protein [Pseudomonas sp. MWU12-2037]